MSIQRVGHVVIKMRDLEQAKQFYQGVLGMQISSETDFGIFFRFNTYHHDIAVFKTSPEADLPKKDQVGLVHIALITDSLQSVKEMYDRCKSLGVAIDHVTDHLITKSFYVHDPEGNTIEIYCDAPEYDWRKDGFGGKYRELDLENVPVAAGD